MNSRIQRELRHLATPPMSNEKPLGVGTTRFIAWGCGNASEVLEKARSLMILVDQAADKWPREDQWLKLLPDWFVKKCSPEITQEEAELELARLSNLAPSEQVEAEENAAWSVSNWLSFLQPENRNWYWWDAKILTSDCVAVAVEVDHWPFPWGSLRWLFRAAGAEKLEAEE
jgi:hypothetical protein